MGPGGIAWLDRPEREDKERPAAVIDALGLRGGEVVADLGAGSGYFTFRIAPKLGKTGKVLAVEIQDEMLETIRRRATAMKLTNVEEVKGSETDLKLPVNGVDIVLMVDVYHELAYPFEVMTKVRKALKPGGRVVFVEYRKEDTQVPIKEVHKMSVEQLEKEMRVVGLARLRTVETLPWQHILIFEKRQCAQVQFEEVEAVVGLEVSTDRISGRVVADSDSIGVTFSHISGKPRRPGGRRPALESHF
jgi:ubiquinone/menaquinone biosynthesis C-methylase UbiE